MRFRKNRTDRNPLANKGNFRELEVQLPYVIVKRYLDVEHPEGFP